MKIELTEGLLSAIDMVSNKRAERVASPGRYVVYYQDEKLVLELFDVKACECPTEIGLDFWKSREKKLADKK